MLDFGAIAGGVGSVLGGLLGGSPSTEGFDQASQDLWWAMRETSNAQQRAFDAYQNAYQTSRGDINAALAAAKKELEPYGQGGLQAFKQLVQLVAPAGGLTPTDMVSGLPPGVGADVTNWLTKTPMYQFPLQEGMNAIQRSAAAKGMALSPATLKGLNNYAQNYAMSAALTPMQSNYQNYLKNIAGLGGVGYNAATQTGQWGMQAGNALADIAMRTGQLYGGTSMQQAALQNDLAKSLANVDVASAGADLSQGNRWQNTLSSALGALGSIGGNVWNQIGSSYGNTVPFNQAGANALKTYQSIWGY